MKKMKQKKHMFDAEIVRGSQNDERAFMLN